MAENDQNQHESGTDVTDSELDLNLSPLGAGEKLDRVLQEIQSRFRELGPLLKEVNYGENQNWEAIEKAFPILGDLSRKSKNYHKWQGRQRVKNGKIVKDKFPFVIPRNRKEDLPCSSAQAVRNSLGQIDESPEYEADVDMDVHEDNDATSQKDSPETDDNINIQVVPELETDQSQEQEQSEGLSENGALRSVGEQEVIDAAEDNIAVEEALESLKDQVIQNEAHQNLENDVLDPMESGDLLKNLPIETDDVITPDTISQSPHFVEESIIDEFNVAEIPAEDLHFYENALVAEDENNNVAQEDNNEQHQIGMDTAFLDREEEESEGLEEDTELTEIVQGKPSTPESPKEPLPPLTPTSLFGSLGGFSSLFGNSSFSYLRPPVEPVVEEDVNSSMISEPAYSDMHSFIDFLKREPKEAVEENVEEMMDMVKENGDEIKEEEVLNDIANDSEAELKIGDGEDSASEAPSTLSSQAVSEKVVEGTDIADAAVNEASDNNKVISSQESMSTEACSLSEKDGNTEENRANNNSLADKKQRDKEFVVSETKDNIIEEKSSDASSQTTLDEEKVEDEESINPEKTPSNTPYDSQFSGDSSQPSVQLAQGSQDSEKTEVKEDSSTEQYKTAENVKSEIRTEDYATASDRETESVYHSDYSIRSGELTHSQNTSIMSNIMKNHKFLNSDMGDAAVSDHAIIPDPEKPCSSQQASLTLNRSSVQATADSQQNSPESQNLFASIFRNVPFYHKPVFSQNNYNDPVVGQEEESVQFLEKKIGVVELADEEADEDGDDSDSNMEMIGSTRKRRDKTQAEVEAKKLRFEAEVVSSEQEEIQNRKRLANRDGNVSGTKFVENVHEAEARGDPVVISMLLDTLEDGFKLQVPDEIVRKMRYHQAEALSFMYSQMIRTKKPVLSKTEDKDVGMILGHCMGLGKTFVCLIFLYMLSLHKDLSWKVERVLILAPVSVIGCWLAEFKKWLHGDLERFTVTEITKETKDRLSRIRQWAQPSTLNVMIMGHEMFTHFCKEGQYVAIRNPSLIIVDEAHVAKSATTQIHNFLCSVPTQRRIAVTGTPMQNNFQELHNLVEFARNGALGDSKLFKDLYMKPIEKGVCKDASDACKKLRYERICVLRDKVQCVMHHRGVEYLEDQIPSKHEYAIYFRLSPTQVKYYELFLKIIHLKYDSSELKKIGNATFLSLMHEFLRICTHLQLLETRSDDHTKAATLITGWQRQHKASLPALPRAYDDSAKFKFVIDLVKECEKVEDKVILFTQSLETINYFQLQFETLGRRWRADGHLKTVIDAEKYEWKKGLDYDVISGQDKGSAFRDQLQRKFNDPNNKRLRFLFVSTKAGSTGMTLTAANRVILFDIHWNPANDRQAFHRAYRIGQKKEVYVYRLIANGTMEACIYKVQFIKDMNNETFFKENDIKKTFSEKETRAFYTLAHEEYNEKTQETIKDYSEKDPCLHKIVKNRPEDFVRITEPDVMLKTSDSDMVMSPEEMKDAHRRCQRDKELITGIVETQDVEEQEREIETLTKVVDETTFLNRLKNQFSGKRKKDARNPFFHIVDDLVKLVSEAYALTSLSEELVGFAKVMTPMEVQKYDLTNVNKTGGLVYTMLLVVPSKLKRFPAVAVKLRQLFTDLHTEFHSDPRFTQAFKKLDKYHGIINK